MAPNHTSAAAIAPATAAAQGRDPQALDPPYTVVLEP
jgi:hypothetical protein